MLFLREISTKKHLGSKIFRAEICFNPLTGGGLGGLGGGFRTGRSSDMPLLIPPPGPPKPPPGRQFKIFRPEVLFNRNMV